MSDRVEVEIIGFEDSSCGPFPCDETRTCELEACAPTEMLLAAFEALRKRMQELYGDRVVLKLTLLDNGIPGYIETIIEEHHPPLPIVLVNGNVTPLGRMSVPLLRNEVEKHLREEK
ncbi:MAG: hypothetical protein QCH35_02015 [Methanomicrobiaceae archaeon]|nr:hypothetical protein [Methanomicrobiaceae archaeon]